MSLIFVLFFFKLNYKQPTYMIVFGTAYSKARARTFSPNEIYFKNASSDKIDSTFTILFKQQYMRFVVGMQQQHKYFSQCISWYVHIEHNIK